MPQLIAGAVTYLGVTGGITIAGTTIAYATIIGYAVTVGAAVAYSSSQNSKLRNAMKGLQDTGRSVMARDPLAFQRGIYGEVPTAGPILFMHTTGAKNEKLHIVEGIAGHEVAQLGAIYFEGPDGLEEVTLDGAGNATGKYAGFFYCAKYLGTTQQNADPTLMAAAPAYWTANHRLRGHAYLYIQFTYSADLYPNGLPTVRCMTKGKKVLDPRVGIYPKVCDMVAGNTHIGCSDVSGLAAGMLVVGAGIVQGTRIVSIDGGGTFFTVDVAPQLTNTTAQLACGVDAWSDNSALCAADYATDFKFGRRIPWYRMNRTGLITEANICDETIVRADLSTEKRYTTNGTYTADQDAMDDLLSAMAGARSDAGGTWSLFAGAYRAPVAGADFGDDDLVGALAVQPRQSMRESYSGVRGTYFAPENNWQPADFPVVKNNTYAQQDGGIRRWKDVAYPFTTSPATAQRLAKADLERGRQQIVVQATYKLKAFRVSVKDTVRLTHADLGWTNKEFEVLAWSLMIKSDLTVLVKTTLRETAAGVWDWANGEETEVDLAPNTTLPNPQTVPAVTGLSALTSGATVLVQGDGTAVPRILVSWNGPGDAYIEQGGFVEVEYRQSGVGNYIPWDTMRGDALEDWLTNVAVGVQYDIRVRFKNQLGVRGAWSTVTSAAVVGDTAATTTPSGLVATAGTGKAIGLDWTDVVDPRLSEYGVYRNTVNSFVGATKIAEVRASAFVDVSVNLSTTYYYWVTSFTGSEVESAPSAVASATTGASPGLDTTPPADPAAPTFNSSGTYNTGDGTVLSYIVVNLPAMPAGAVVLNILYRRNGASGWILADQKSSGGGTVRIDDLSPGIHYEVAAQAFSAYSYASAIVAATGTPFLAPNKSSTVSAPTGGTISADGVSPKLITGTQVYLYGSVIAWNISVDNDIAFYEVKATFTNSDGAVDYTWTSYDGVSTGIQQVRDARITLYNSTNVSGFVRVRAVNRSGVASAWLYIGNANSASSLGAGTIAVQNKNAVAVTGITTGAGGSQRKVVARQPIYGTIAVTGGAASETVNFSLTNYGFSVRPDAGWLQSADWDRLLIRYDIDDSTSTNAVLRLTMADGTNLPTLASLEVTGEFVEYD